MPEYAKQSPVPWEQRDPEKGAAMLMLLRDPSITYQQIADEFGISMGAVVSVAKRNNLQRYANRVKHEPQDDAEKQLRALEDEIKEKMKTLQRLREEVEAQRFYFNYDKDGTITIFNVGAEPMKAHFKQWMRFLNQEGARQLREFISVYLKEKNNGPQN